MAYSPHHEQSVRRNMSQQTQTLYTVLFNNSKYDYSNDSNNSTIIYLFLFFCDLVQTPRQTHKTSLNDSEDTPLQLLAHEEPDIKMDKQGCFKYSNERIHHIWRPPEQRLIMYAVRNAWFQPDFTQLQLPASRSHSASALSTILRSDL